jgi:ABC-type dipeptide/oligopeptide/nickel transport system permease component
VQRGFLAFVARRVIAAATLVLLVSSAALLLARLGSSGRADPEVDPEVAAAECARIRCNDPLLLQYVTWLGRAMRFDLGDSSRFGRPVRQLIAERAPNSFVLGMCALLVATAIGIPAGVLTGSRRGIASRVTSAGSILLLSFPPLVLGLTLLLLAARTRWLPVAGMAPPGATISEHLRYLVLPVLTLALPMAATLERLQSRAIADALEERCLLAASARGLTAARLVWRHAWMLSLKPVLAVYGIVVGALLGGSFVVEYIMAWPGLGALLYEALVARDAYLAAGCAAAGAVVLAVGILGSDIAMAAVDPRLTEHG